MGTEVVKAIKSASDMETVALVDKGYSDESRYSDQSDILLSNDIESALISSKPDVVVDFTNADGCMSCVEIAVAKGVRVVSGSTGLTDKNIAKLSSLATEARSGILIASNFALGMVILLSLVRKVAPHFEYADIIEAHHEAKIDAPSGTALALAYAMTEQKEFRRNQTEIMNLDASTGGDINGVGVHSLRQPGRSAHHEVIFGASGQTLTLRHDVLSRDSYMPGVLAAVRSVSDIEGLVFGLENILGL
jgi:4-hydroxy-tetrahydrodipicolinate reductase